jgi:hypothetical protein
VALDRTRYSRGVDVPSGARCERHPEWEAVVTCERCGSFACGSCVGGPARRHCGPCARLIATYGSWTPVWAAILSFLSFGCGVLAFVAIGVALYDIVRGRTSGRPLPPAAVRLDGLAIVLGLAGIGLWALVVHHLYMSDDPPLWGGDAHDAYR